MNASISIVEQERRRKFSRVAVTHGQYKTPEYAAWLNMRGRCLNPQHPNFHQYGGRGVMPCASWEKFENFIADMGKRPTPRHTLERNDNSKGYTPDNCSWKPQSEQIRNTRRTIRMKLDGKTYCLKDWCMLQGVDYEMFNRRFHAGWTLNEALFTPVQTQFRKKSYANR